jgi:hypothetical protein
LASATQKKRWQKLIPIIILGKKYASPCTERVHPHTPRRTQHKAYGQTECRGLINHSPSVAGDSIQLDPFMYLLMLLLCVYTYIRVYITIAQQFSRSTGYTQKPIIILLLVDAALLLMRERERLPHFCIMPKKRSLVGVPHSLSLHNADANFMPSSVFATFCTLCISFWPTSSTSVCLHRCSMAFNYYWHKMDECNCVIKQYNAAATASACAFERYAYCAVSALFILENNHGSMMPVGAAGQSVVGATFW